jgi:hypothetical protein
VTRLSWRHPRRSARPSNRRRRCSRCRRRSWWSRLTWTPYPSRSSAGIGRDRPGSCTSCMVMHCSSVLRAGFGLVGEKRLPGGEAVSPTRRRNGAHDHARALHDRLGCAARPPASRFTRSSRVAGRCPTRGARLFASSLSVAGTFGPVARRVGRVQPVGTTVRGPDRRGHSRSGGGHKGGRPRSRRPRGGAPTRHRSCGRRPGRSG